MRVLLVLFAVLTACNKVYTPDTSRPAVVFGDSIAFGTGTSHQRFNLASCLGKNTGAYFQNLGKPGETTREALRRMPEVLALKPKLIVLSIGGNDLQQHLGKQGYFPVAETEANLAAIFAQLNREGIPVFYINMEPPLANSNLRAAAAAGDGRLGKIEALARQFPNIHFVKAAMQGLWQNPEKMADEIHPNDRGYADMCAQILNEIRQSSRR